MLESPLTKSAASTPPPVALPPETAREKLANAVIILRANTLVSLDNAFQPAGAYNRALDLLESALTQIDRERP